MRTHRLLTALLGLALLGLAPLTASASTAAPEPVDLVATPAAPATAAPATAARTKLSRELNDRSVQRGGSWYVVGRITPEGSRKAITFKRKLGPKAPWRTWKRVKADNRGRFQVVMDFPAGTSATWFYKGVVYGGVKYADARTDNIYTACRRENC